MTAPLRVLLVSYSFPPVGGAGVQRVLKLVKYLPAHGVVPEVLTVENPSVPVLDPSLLADVPTGVEVHRARTLEPPYSAKKLAWDATAGTSMDFLAVQRGRLFALARKLVVPDLQALWLPHAALALLERLRKSHPDVVCISGPPFSEFLLAPLCGLSPGTAVVLDYRDEWTTAASVFEMGSSTSLNRFLERATLRFCHGVTTATEAFRLSLLERFGFLEPSAVSTVPNGFDPDDFPDPLPVPPNDRFVLTYVGTVFRLTSARGLLGAIRLLHERSPDLGRLLEVRFFGRVVETEAKWFEKMADLGVHRLGYVEHERATAELARSHAVLCLLEDLPGAERVYPAKIFEIMHTRRRCLAVAPAGVLATLVRRHHLGDVVSPSDPARICDWLARELTEFRASDPLSRTALDAHPTDVAKFHRKAIAGEFARAFRAASARARRRSRQSEAFGSAAALQSASTK